MHLFKLHFFRRRDWIVDDNDNSGKEDGWELSWTKRWIWWVKGYPNLGERAFMVWFPHRRDVFLALWLHIVMKTSPNPWYWPPNRRKYRLKMPG